MSWGTTYRFKDGELTETGNLEIILTDEMKEQKIHAELAVKSLIDSGALGHNKEFKVTVSGHANKNHEPAKGWTNDSMMLSIYQVEEGTP